MSPYRAAKKKDSTSTNMQGEVFFHGTKYLSCEFGLVMGNRRAGSKLEGTCGEAGNKFSNKNGKNIYGLVFVLQLP